MTHRIGHVTAALGPVDAPVGEAWRRQTIVLSDWPVGGKTLEHAGIDHRSAGQVRDVTARADHAEQQGTWARGGARAQHQVRRAFGPRISHDAQGRRARWARCPVLGGRLAP